MESEYIVLLHEGFIGETYRLTNNWLDYVNINDFMHKPINYLEIGTLYGANILSFANTYGRHDGSKLYCIDPWEDYDEYSEYKNQQSIIYSSFFTNIENSGVKKDKIIIKRGYSNIEIPNLKDNFFDIIYIDGNHDPEYVLEDAVLSFRKLKVNGIMIFDDYGWSGSEVVKGVDGFVDVYSKRIKLLGLKNGQVFIEKIK
jgi:predicted O-methyltransferase YrrM